mgnify:CR=1 FL=1
MNFITRFTSVVQHLVHGPKIPGSACNFTSHRAFSALTGGSTSVTGENKTRAQSSLLPLQKQCIQLNQSRGYKVKLFPKKRCAGCFFVHRFGRLYVECTVKPRHKQMQKVMGMNFFKHDYSKGQWKKASIWGFRDNKIFYQLENKMAKFDWLKGRIGKDL